jgi:hypothetical protein
LVHPRPSSSLPPGTRGYRFVGPAVTSEEAAASSAAPALSLPDRPSIAVLTFTNLSGDPEQEYFADGIVEDITTALSRMRWLFVIAGNSSFAFKGRAVDTKQIGRELGLRRTPIFGGHRHHRGGGPVRAGRRRLRGHRRLFPLSSLL